MDEALLQSFLKKLGNGRLSPLEFSQGLRSGLPEIVNSCGDRRNRQHLWGKCCQDRLRRQNEKTHKSVNVHLCADPSFLCEFVPTDFKISKTLQYFNMWNLGGACQKKRRKSPREIEGLRGTESPRKFRESQRVPESPRGPSKKQHIASKRLAQGSAAPAANSAAAQRCHYQRLHRGPTVAEGLGIAGREA